MGYRLRDLGRARTCRGSGGVGLVGLGMYFFLIFHPSKERKKYACSGLMVRYRIVS